MTFIMLDGQYDDEDYFVIVTPRNTIISAPLFALFEGQVNIPQNWN